MLKKQTVFIEIADKFFNSENLSTSSFLEIFREGYTITKEDKEYVSSLYKKVNNENDYLIKWSYIRFIQKLNNIEEIELAVKKYKVLFVILSLKLDKPIYYNFPNLLGVINNAMEHYKTSGDIILKAIKVYGQTEKINTLDLKKGVFKRKLKEYNENKPSQDENFEIIVKKLFKELE